MGQKWRKIRRRCSSFNTGSGKSRSDDRETCGGGDDRLDRGPLIPPSSPSDDDPSAASPSPATTVHDMLRARLNMLNIGGGDKHRPVQRGGQRSAAADRSSTFYVPSPLLRTDGEQRRDDDTGPCSLPVAFDLCAADSRLHHHHHQHHHQQQQRLVRPSSLCRAAAETPSSCGSSGRGTADDGAGSDRSSVSYSDHGYNSIASTGVTVANGYDFAADR